MSLIQVVIETPRGSREKYDYDEKTNSYFLKKLLPLGMCFPYDFGFIPGTKGEDGDPLDAMVISEFNTFPGCRVKCRLVGALKAEQTEKGKTIRNDRFFFIPEVSVVYKHILSIKNFPGNHIKELLFFFINYNEPEGKEFNPLKVISPEKALKLLNK
jgi:inorganic pyrophosphatase